MKKRTKNGIIIGIALLTVYSIGSYDKPIAESPVIEAIDHRQSEQAQSIADAIRSWLPEGKTEEEKESERAEEQAEAERKVAEKLAKEEAKQAERESKQAEKQAEKERKEAERAEKQAEAERKEAEKLAKEESEMEYEEMMRNREFIVDLFETDAKVMAEHMMQYEGTAQWAHDFGIYAENIRMTIDHVEMLEDEEMAQAFAPIEEAIDMLTDAIELNEPVLVEPATELFLEGIERVNKLEGAE